MKGKKTFQKRVIYKFICPECLTPVSLMRWNKVDVPKCNYCNVPLEVVKTRVVRK